MGSINVLVLTIHILAASFWIGGMLFMVLALSPYVRKLPKEISIQAYQSVGKRYSFWGTIIGLPVLFITGVYNMHTMGISFSELMNSNNPYASTLHLKIHLFALTAILAAIHDFYLGPRSHLNEKFKVSARIIGIVNLILGLLIIYLAAKLRLGG
ncbi:CopD family protein [Persephonella sp. KM09-Lau-8]|uniref:CopD family protein n=1 Tax=Persephonella sp. KM09-Lau-8 TaxID=1158345 RepID=UPI00049528B3|nr:CopD family protein [Persephonella sp. KM09-Lau-8]